jgi:hypothetical protein
MRARLAAPLVGVGAVLVIVAPFLPWLHEPQFFAALRETRNLYQWNTGNGSTVLNSAPLVLAAVVLVLFVMRLSGWLRLAALTAGVVAALVYGFHIRALIQYVHGSFGNAHPRLGPWVALTGALLLVAGAAWLPRTAVRAPRLWRFRHLVVAAVAVACLAVPIGVAVAEQAASGPPCDKAHHCVSLSFGGATSSQVRITAVSTLKVPATDTRAAEVAFAVWALALAGFAVVALLPRRYLAGSERA